VSTTSAWDDRNGTRGTRNPAAKAILVGVNYLGRSATTILAGLRRGSCRRSCRQDIFGFPGAAACAASLL
jgi:hypothetical protein